MRIQAGCNASSRRADAEAARERCAGLDSAASRPAILHTGKALDPTTPRYCDHCGEARVGMRFCPQDGRPTTATTAIAKAMPGDVIDARYRLERPLGAGGMATVFCATDLHTGEARALKLSHPQAHQERWSRKRIWREMRVAAALNHPNLCAVLDGGVDPQGRLYMVTELIRGRSLAQAIYGGSPLPTVDQIKGWLDQIGRGLRYLEQANIVHRDIKADNVMLSDDGTIKVIDFGICRLTFLPEPVRALPMSARSIWATNPDVILGSPGYMSPERIQGEPGDGRSDLYALGVILYELLEGRLPFDGDVYEVARGHLRAPPAPFRRNDAAAAGLQQICLRLLAKSPAERFQDAGRLLEALGTA